MTVPTGTRVKSTMTSARSAGPISSCVSLAGRGRKPPSAPICQNGSPSRSSCRISVRALQAFRKRNRYRRCSTFRYGQVLPLTIMVLPKNSGFQIGDTSLGRLSQVTAGMKGICRSAGETPSKNARSLGKNNEPSALNERSWIMIGIS